MYLLYFALVCILYFGTVAEGVSAVDLQLCARLETRCKSFQALFSSHTQAMVMCVHALSSLMT